MGNVSLINGHIDEPILKEYCIYRMGATLELVSFVKAKSIEDAEKWAVRNGYDLEYYRVEEE